jgi:carboxyl-terminal processing protease
VLLVIALAGASFLLGTRMTAVPEGFEAVVDAAEEIRSRSAEPVDQDELIRGALRGMLQTLDDPYAAFLGRGETSGTEALTSGSFTGIGVWVEAAEGGLRVASVLEGSPARDAGLTPGDLVVRVDGEPVSGVSASEAGALLSGEEGTDVTLTVSSGGEEREITITRRRIELAQVQSRVVEGGVVYVRPLHFGRGVAETVSARLRDLGGQGASGVVLDLRGNAGGLTGEAVDVAGLFLGPEVVGRTREDGGEEALRTDGPAVTGLPLAVLVDGGTASAAELVAGALRDHGRGTLIGTQTYGKGSLLAVSEIEGAGSIRYTTGTFTTPNGDQVEGVGLIPDVPVLPGGPIDAQLDRALRALLGEAAA